MTNSTSTETPAAKAEKVAKPAKKASARKPANGTKVDPIESAIRNYLIFLADPSKLVDVDAVANARETVDGASDPIDKLKALAALDKLTNIDPAPFIEAFVAHAKDWAAGSGITASSFQKMGVPADVLISAGFEVEIQVAHNPRKAAGGQPGKRAKAVPKATVAAWVRIQTEDFVLTDVIEKCGGSQATVRGTLDDMIKAGEVDKLGPVATFAGRGRAPIAYRYTGKAAAA